MGDGVVVRPDQVSLGVLVTAVPLMGHAFSRQLSGGYLCCLLPVQVLVMDLEWGLVAES